MFGTTCMLLCGSFCVCISRSGPRVRAGTRPSLRPLGFEGGELKQSSGEIRREAAKVCLRAGLRATNSTKRSVPTILAPQLNWWARRCAPLPTLRHCTLGCALEHRNDGGETGRRTPLSCPGRSAALPAMRSIVRCGALQSRGPSRRVSPCCPGSRRCAATLRVAACPGHERRGATGRPHEIQRVETMRKSQSHTAATGLPSSGHVKCC
ncbi:hypothetical protein ABH975_002480 [Bradyrhizobium ottawaense]